jgi:predicted ATPase
VVSGEAGIGKSRLAAELLRTLVGTAHARLRYFCSSHRQNSPLYPCIQQLEYAAGFARGDSPESKLAKLEALLDQTTEQDLGLIAELLLLPTGNRFPVLQFAPQRKRQRLMEALIGLLERAALNVPLLLILEDAQWSDASTRELLTMLAARVAGHRILCIVTARPEFDAAWLRQPQVKRIMLNPLRAEESAMLVSRVAGGRPLPSAAVNDIVMRTDGVPLYVEEMTQAVIESGSMSDARPELPSRANVPVSLQASLLARLDRLGGAREIAEVAAAIGREFTQELLTEAADCSVEDAGRALDRLVDSGLVVRRSTFGPGETGFGFRHMLIRDTAYNLMVRKKRKSVHAEIAKALEKSFPDRAAANPEIAAYHCTEGGLTEKAAGYWLAAGHQALRRSAMAEALTHLARGLELIKEVPDGPWRSQCELDLTVALGKAQIATQGYAVASTGETYARARALCEKFGDPPQLLSVLHGLWTHALMRAELDSARKQALDLLERGEERKDPLWRLMGCRFSGVTHHPLGAFAEAHKYLTRGLELYDPAAIGKYAMITVDDPRVVMLTYLSWSLMCMGRLDEANRRGAEALEGARALGHAFTIAHALNGASFLALTIDSPEVALQRLDELMPLLEEHGIAYYGAVGILFRGWCLAALGQAAEADALLRRGMAAYRATGSRLYLSGFLRMSAEAYGRIGQTSIALEQIHEAFQLMYATSQRWDEAEIHRVHGGLLLAARDTDSAIAALRRSLKISRAQHAGLWELRAACDLSRLNAEQGERRRAHDLLAPVCASFEGQSDAPDIRKARALLDGLT